MLCLVLFTRGAFLWAQPGTIQDKVSQQLDRAAELTSSQPEQALAAALAALKGAQTHHLTFSEGKAYQLLARIYAERSEYTKALEASKSGVALFDRLGEAKETCRMYIGMGIINRYLKLYPAAIESNLQAESIAKKQAFTLQLAAIYGNLGNIYFDRQDYNHALEYHRKSLQIHESLGDEQGMGNTFHNLGMIYRMQKQYDKALDYYNRSLAIDSRKNNLGNVAISYTDLARLYIAKNDFREALVYAEKSFGIARKIDAKALEQAALSLLPLIHAALGNQDLALRHHQDYISLSDSLQSAKLSKQIADMQARYQTEQKNRELRLQSLRLQAQQASLSQQRMLITVLIAFVLLAALIGYLLFNRYKLRQYNLKLSLENQQYQLSQKLQLRNEETELLLTETAHIKQLDRVKSQFFANISHEFRTPLQLILAPLQKQGSITGEEAHMMERNANRLLRLVNQLLDLAKAEMGMLKLNYQWDNLIGFLRQTALYFEPMAKAKKLLYQIDLPASEPLVAYDADKLEKIVYNLLSNAIKFTPSGGRVILRVELRVEHRVEADRPGGLWITVSDSGVGMPESLQSRIFDRFYQIDSSETRAFEGSGLGLALTKELVDLHHGSIRVNSLPESGSTFEVWLPLKTDAPSFDNDLHRVVSTIGTGQSADKAVARPNFLTKQESAELTQEDRPTLLLVEDHPELNHYLRQQLSDRFQVVHAMQGDEGLVVARSLIPDLIVSDIMMPVMDGFSLTRCLKEDDLTSHIPVILLTAKDDIDSRMEGFELGAEQYLAKPFVLDELVARINSLLAQRHLLRKKYSREVVLQPTGTPVRDREGEFLEKVIRIIDEHISQEDFNVEMLQQEMGMSRMQLHRKLKALTDQSASDFIRYIRLQRAADLLQKSGSPVAEVAYKSGFNHLSYFSKCFKEQFGMLPSEYARQKHTDNSEYRY
ncbi:Tetratricopeptide repeat-containing protein [Dyadobacter sp. SG02]|nr:Tetratricopeptide repeat-containing protein [Dyadobacter sp. SG02]